MRYKLATNSEAARLKVYLLKSGQEDQLRQFQQLPAYTSLLKLHHPMLHAEMQCTPENKFHRLFICPHKSQLSFQHMRKFIAVDRTFLKARYVLSLLFAVGIDANGGVVESENTDSWSWFLSHLKAAIPETVGMTLISDHDKGLLNAQELVYGDTISVCCFHLKVDSYEREIYKLEQVNPGAVNYISI